ncbi:hypothetical protein BB560_004880 [Smittium megazygosporum]|uniref:Oxidase FUB9 n=1 Tax=Smittium megazygosporum TaxID=133381 RepID=A0A2T9Z854_9FUNG|nr:hypothetical protein BB560_004880 [Smittium megazygosporum]
MNIASISDLEKIAENKLSKHIFGYYSYGAQDMISTKDNSAAFDRIKIYPRVLRDVSNIDTKVNVFGKTLDSPIFIAATALQKLAHSDGEVGAARAAKRRNVVYSLSTFSTGSIEQVAESLNPNLWFQVSFFKDKNITLSLINRAEKAGFQAIIVTVDMPYSGRRLPDIREPLTVPDHISFANFVSETDDKPSDGWIGHHVVHGVESNLSWDSIKWIKANTKLPVLAKGILSPEDAKLAVEAKIDGIIVSNHGGRQLDSVPATIDALPGVADAVQNRIPVFFDGGVRRGTDVFKAIAYGATAVFVGRPNLFGLAYNGEKGVDLVLDILNEEFKLSMALAGCSSVKQINRSYVRKMPTYTSKL